MSAILLLIAVFAAGRIEATGPCPYQMDLLFIVDGSDSVTEGNPDAWNLVRQFMHKMALNLTIGPSNTLTGMVAYGDVAKKVWNFKENQNIDSLLPVIDNVPMPGGELNALITADVVLFDEFIFWSGDRLFVPNVAVVICDGMKEYSADETGFVAELFQIAGVEFFVVCVTGTSGKCSHATASEIASKPTPTVPQTYWLVPDYASIESIRESVMGNICAYLEACSHTLLNCLAL